MAQLIQCPECGRDDLHTPPGLTMHRCEEFDIMKWQGQNLFKISESLKDILSELKK